MKRSKSRSRKAFQVFLFDKNFVTKFDKWRIVVCSIYFLGDDAELH